MPLHPYIVPPLSNPYFFPPPRPVFCVHFLSLATETDTKYLQPIDHLNAHRHHIRKPHQVGSSTTTNNSSRDCQGRQTNHLLPYRPVPTETLHHIDAQAEY